MRRIVRKLGSGEVQAQPDFVAASSGNSDDECTDEDDLELANVEPDEVT